LSAVKSILDPNQGLAPFTSSFLARFYENLVWTMAMDKTTALSRIASFSELAQPLLGRLSDLSGLQRIGKGSILFRMGERAHFVYALVEGSVSLLSGPRHEEIIAEFLEVGDIFLIPPALLALPYMVTAKAVTDVLVIMIPAEEFIRISETELALSVALNRVLAGHWRLLLRHLTQTKSRAADARVIQYLMDSAGVAAGAARFILPGTKKDLAAHLGITPETLSRSLKRLSRLGVTSAGAEMRIVDVSRLRSLLQDQRHVSPQQLAVTSAKEQ
jgi:CRP/FNR family transcriptional activator FtrB